MRVRSKVLLVAAGIAGVLLAGGAPVSAVSGVTAHGVGGFGAAPAHSDPNDPSTRAYFKPVVAAGRSMTDQVQVTSTSDSSIKLIVSAVDGLTGKTSGAVYANRQDRVSKAGLWVRPAVSSLTLLPHSQRLVSFTVAVPAGATPGDHLAGIAFEDANPHGSGGQFGVTEIVRTVVGVDITVPGPAAPHLRLSGLGLAAMPGLKYATVTVHLGDNGRKLVKPGLAVTLHGPRGYGRTYRRTLDTILPGDTIAYPFVWPDNLAAGTYTITAVATNGSERETESATAHIGTALQGAARPAGIVVRNITRPFGSVPMIGIAFGVVILALFVGFRVGSRRAPNLAR